jgi:hypothetical protein
MVASAFAIAALVLAALVWAPSTVTAFTTTTPTVAALPDDDGHCQDGSGQNDNGQNGNGQGGNGGNQNSDSHCVKPTPTPAPPSTVTAVSINTTTGPCANNIGGCGAAVYTASGFSGTVSYAYPGRLSQLADFLCVHTPASVAFVSLGGAYTLTARSSGGALLATSSYTVTGNVDCRGDANPVAGTVRSFTVPADGRVSYSVMVSGLTAANCPTSLSAYNAIRDQVFDLASEAHVASPAVAPCGAPPLVPEAPFSALLMVTAGLASLFFVARRLGLDPIGHGFSSGQAPRGL